MTEEIVWFITGASRGFGRSFAEYALEKGYKVVATARNVNKLSDLKEKYNKDQLLTHTLDVTSSRDIIKAIEEAYKAFGHINVLISNAGYNMIGPVEEVTNEQLRQVFDINFFGAVELIRKILPYMRDQGYGTIVQVSSVQGSVTHAGYGAYAATKHALEGLFQALQEEIASFGLSTMLIKPGAFRTDILKPTGNLTTTSSIGVYDEYLVKGQHTRIHGEQLGDPYRAAKVMDEALQLKKMPMQLLLGSDSYDAVMKELNHEINENKKYESLTKSTDFPTQNMKAEEGVGKT